MRMSRNVARGLLALAVGALPVAVLVTAGGCAVSERRHPITSGWVFDAGDPRLVAGYADAVVVAEVVAERALSGDPPGTLFTVEVWAALKGKPSDIIGVRQTGARRCDGIHEDDDQPLLAIGGVYILNLTHAAGGEMTLIGGPVSASRVDDQHARAEAVAVWREHVRDQHDPGLPKHK